MNPFFAQSTAHADIAPFQKVSGVVGVINDWAGVGILWALASVPVKLNVLVHFKLKVSASIIQSALPAVSAFEASNRILFWADKTLIIKEIQAKKQYFFSNILR